MVIDPSFSGTNLSSYIQARCISVFKELTDNPYCAIFVIIL